MAISQDLSGAFEKEVDKLETKLKEYTDKKASIDKQITQYRAEILEFTKEIDNLEKQKAEIAWDKSLPTREIINQEATKDVEHAEVSLNLGLEVESLEETHDRLMARLNVSKVKLEEFKSKFPI